MILVSDFQVEDVSNSLSGKVPIGERAMSLAVDNIAGISGLLRPGDRVDILGTFPVGTKSELIKDASGRESVGYVTMTLLQNVTLLATGNQIATGGSQDDQQRRKAYASVTMSVTIEEAELLTIAQTRGKMNLLLRHREDVDITNIQKKTLKEVLTQLEVIQETRDNRRKKVRRPAKKLECKPGEELSPDKKKCVRKIVVMDGSN